MRRVRRCVRTGGHPRLATGTTPPAPRVRSAPSPPHAAAAAPAQGWGTGTPPGRAPPAHHHAPQSRQERACAPLWWLWQKVGAALDSGAAFALLDPRASGNFCKDLETLWWQHLALGLSEGQRDSPACVNTGGSNDISLTSGHGCHSRNASSIHREGLQMNQTKAVPVVPGLCSPVP